MSVGPFQGGDPCDQCRPSGPAGYRRVCVADNIFAEVRAMRPAYPWTVVARSLSLKGLHRFDDSPWIGPTLARGAPVGMRRLCRAGRAGANAAAVVRQSRVGLPAERSSARPRGMKARGYAQIASDNHGAAHPGKACKVLMISHTSALALSVNQSVK